MITKPDVIAQELEESIAMKKKIMVDRRKGDRRRSTPEGDILCRRIFGDRRKQNVATVPVPWWLMPQSKERAKMDVELEI